MQTITELQEELKKNMPHNYYYEISNKNMDLNGNRVHQLVIFKDFFPIAPVDYQPFNNSLLDTLIELNKFFK